MHEFFSWDGGNIYDDEIIDSVYEKYIVSVDYSQKNFFATEDTEDVEERERENYNVYLKIFDIMIGITGYTHYWYIQGLSFKTE